MNLRLQATADARRILEDRRGFGWPISVQNPAGVSAELTGFSTDIAQTIDPETNQAVSGARASVSLPIAAVMEAFEGLPVNIHDESEAPWMVIFDDVLGTSRTFKVTDTLPDYAVGVVVLTLESYREAEP